MDKENPDSSSEKVNLPRVEKKTRIRLNVIKAKRDDKDIDATLNHLMDLEEEKEVG